MMYVRAICPTCGKTKMWTRNREGIRLWDLCRISRDRGYAIEECGETEINDSCECNESPKVLTIDDKPVVVSLTLQHQADAPDTDENGIWSVEEKSVSSEKIE